MPPWPRSRPPARIRVASCESRGQCRISFRSFDLRRFREPLARAPDYSRFPWGRNLASSGILRLVQKPVRPSLTVEKIEGSIFVSFALFLRDHGCGKNAPRHFMPERASKYCSPSNRHSRFPRSKSRQSSSQNGG